MLRIPHLPLEADALLYLVKKLHWDFIVILMHAGSVRVVAEESTRPRSAVDLVMPIELVGICHHILRLGRTPVMGDILVKVQKVS